jgi:hypothetical protein
MVVPDEAAVLSAEAGWIHLESSMAVPERRACNVGFTMPARPELLAAQAGEGLWRHRAHPRLRRDARVLPLLSAW